MASNLEYIYTLRDRYSKKLASITRKQLAFTEAYRKSMGKVNSASVHHGRIVAKNTQIYNSNKQAMARVNTHLNILTKSQGKYSRESSRRIAKLNQEWRKHGKVVKAQQSKQKGGGLAGMAGGVGGAFFLGDVIKTSADFYQNLNAIKAVIPDVDFGMMKKKALEWGITTKFSAVQVAGAMREAAQAGMTGGRGREVLESMPGNLALAAAGQMTLVEAMVLSTDVVNQFGKSVSNLEIADQLATAASNSTSTVTMLGAALKNTGTIAHQAGLKSTDTIKMLMAIGETGLRGEIGGTMLMNMIMFMKRMGPKVKRGLETFLKGTGVAISDLVNAETGQIIDPDRFGKLLITANQKQLNALTNAFEIRGGKAVGSLAQLSMEKFEKFKRVMMDTTGASKRMADILLEGLPGALTRLDSAWTTSKIIMLDSFVKPLSAAMEKLAKLLVYLALNHKWLLNLVIGVVSLATVLGSIGIVAWVVAGTFANLVLVWGALAKVISLATYKMIWTKTVMFALAIVSKAATAALWLLNIAMMSTPVGILLVAMAALVGLFIYAVAKTGSLTGAFKLMGGVLLRVVLVPVNAVILALRLLLHIASKLPDVLGGGAFKTQYDIVTADQLKMNAYAAQVGVPVPADKLDQKTRDAATQRTEYVTRPIEVGGDIRVSAEPGSKVTKKSFDFNMGANMNMGMRGMAY